MLFSPSLSHQPADRPAFTVMVQDDRLETATWQTAATAHTEDEAYDFINGAFPFAEYAITTDVSAFLDAAVA